MNSVQSIGERHRERSTVGLENEGCAGRRL